MESSSVCDSSEGLGVFKEGDSTVLAGVGVGVALLHIKCCCYLSIQRFQIPVFNFFLPQGAPLGFSKILYPGTQACKEDHMRYLHAIRL